MKNRPNYVININGGAGKNVMFSAVVKNLKKSFPEYDLIAVSPYPEVLINLPQITRVYRQGSTPYLYEDLVLGDGNKVSALDPYQDENYLLEKEHLIQTWSRMLGGNDEMQMPEINITHREFINFRNKHAGSLNNYSKPILVINPFGGVPKEGSKYNWCRDIPVDQAQEIVEALNDAYTVVQILRPDQISLRGCITFSGTFREIACLLKLSEKRILIDSFAQHCAAALNLPSVVCWVTNTPRVFGYGLHTNIFAEPYEAKIDKIDSLFQEENWTGDYMHYYPYPDSNVFDIDKILSEVFSSKPSLVDNFAKTSVM